MSSARPCDILTLICTRIGDLTVPGIDYDIELQEALAFDQTCNAIINDILRGTEAASLTTRQTNQLEKLAAQTARVRELGLRAVGSSDDIELLFRALLGHLQSKVDQMRALAARMKIDDELINAGEQTIRKISSIRPNP